MRALLHIYFLCIVFIIVLYIGLYHELFGLFGFAQNVYMYSLVRLCAVKRLGENG